MANINELKWIKRYFKIANEISTWSKDPSTKVGAIIVNKNGAIIAQGYNGFPRGVEDKDEFYHNRDIKYSRIIHAEVNAILNAASEGVSVYGSSLYVHGLPVCSECCKFIIQSGIKHVYYDTEPSERWKQSSQLSKSLFDEAGVKYTYVK